MSAVHFRSGMALTARFSGGLGCGAVAASRPRRFDRELNIAGDAGDWSRRPAGNSRVFRWRVPMTVPVTRNPILPATRSPPDWPHAFASSSCAKSKSSSGSPSGCESASVGSPSSAGQRVARRRVDDRPQSAGAIPGGRGRQARRQRQHRRSDLEGDQPIACDRARRLRACLRRAIPATQASPHQGRRYPPYRRSPRSLRTDDELAVCRQNRDDFERLRPALNTERNTPR